MENKLYCFPSLDNQMSYHFASNSNPNALTMQTSALHTLLADSNSSTESLDYFNASLPKIKIDPVQPVQPVNLQPLKLDDDDVSIEYLPTSPSPTPTLVDKTPAPLPTREEQHRTAHTAQEVEAKANAANTATKKYCANTANNFCAAFNKMAIPAAHTTLPTIMQSCTNLQHIYQILHPLSDSEDKSIDNDYYAPWTILLSHAVLYLYSLTICTTRPFLPDYNFLILLTYYLDT